MFKKNVVEVIKEGHIVSMSERQARDEDLFILRMPEVEETSVTEYLDISTSSKLSKKPVYEVNNVISELVDNFHWRLVKVRRDKGLTRMNVAKSVGASEEEIKELEYGRVSKDDFVLINKVQKVLGINLRKDGKTFEESPRALVEKGLKEKAKTKAKESAVIEDVFSGNDIDIID